MKANELRIGNIVEGIGMEEPIRRINDSIQYNYKTERFELDAIDIQYFKPILLTEEWLLKFGFNHKGEEYYQVGRYEFDISNGLIDDGYTAVNLENPIKYVHQLQNLYYALTGQELTINEN